MYRRALILMFAVAAIFATAVAALAGAGGKQPQYDSASKASGHSEFSLADIFQANSGGGSYTDNTGTGGDSEASSSLAVVPDASAEASCSSEGVAQSGKQWDTDSNSWKEIAVDPLPLEVGIVHAYCEDGSVQQNNTDSGAGADLVYVGVTDVADACVICTYSGSKTTSGQAQADSGSELVGADVLGTEVSLIECGEEAQAMNQNDTGGTYSSLLSIGDVAIDSPVCLLPEGSTTNDATADYGQVGPNEG